MNTINPVSTKSGAVHIASYAPPSNQVTTGVVSALAGPHDDTRLLQITAPVQAGNSGGPLLDERGNVIGIVVGKLDALKVAGLTGDLPENVNFAINASLARAFLEARQVVYETAAPDNPRNPVKTHPSIRLIDVTLANRESLPAELARMLAAPQPRRTTRKE